MFVEGGGALVFVAGGTLLFVSVRAGGGAGSGLYVVADMGGGGGGEGCGMKVSPGAGADIVPSVLVGAASIAIGLPN